MIHVSLPTACVQLLLTSLPPLQQGPLRVFIWHLHAPPSRKIIKRRSIPLSWCSPQPGEQGWAVFQSNSVSQHPGLVYGLHTCMGPQHTHSHLVPHLSHPQLIPPVWPSSNSILCAYLLQSLWPSTIAHNILYDMKPASFQIFCHLCSQFPGFCQMELLMKPEHATLLYSCMALHYYSFRLESFSFMPFSLCLFGQFLVILLKRPFYVKETWTIFF